MTPNQILMRRRRLQAFSGEAVTSHIIRLCFGYVAWSGIVLFYMESQKKLFFDTFPLMPSTKMITLIYSNRRLFFFLYSCRKFILTFANSEVLHTSLKQALTLTPPPTLCLPFCLFLCDRVSNTTAGGEGGRAGGRKRVGEGLRGCKSAARNPVWHEKRATRKRVAPQKVEEKHLVCIRLYVRHGVR